MQKISQETGKQIVEMRAEGVPILQISRATGINRPTIYDYLARQDGKTKRSYGYHATDIGEALEQTVARCRRMEQDFDSIQPGDTIEYRIITKRRKIAFLSQVIDKYPHNFRILGLEGHPITVIRSDILQGIVRRVTV